ncbi:MAG: tRNA uridine-5-carboxymethylaminomethyl(34) synthesis enzyme MnmG [Myxococcota bacterium]|nr:tRNA uridine-5-carboxymethylaminomethyl(34) synthesis enzyme MnmG [Myxococcota bacterium]
MKHQARVVVVGGGHAGAEAASAAARMGLPVTLVTLVRGAIGRMPCNPAIGGQAKGHLVRELDALGGEMALVADATSIQFKYLNTRKGLAVRSSRAQVDRHLYQRRMARRLAAIPGLDIVEGEVVGLELQEGRLQGVRLADGMVLTASAVVVTAGTSLKGTLHTGVFSRSGGGNGAQACNSLSASLTEAGHRLGRLKTGTVPRLDGRTIRWDQLTAQSGDHPGGRLSFLGPASRLPQVLCYVTRTNSKTHTVLRDGLRHSPLYGDRPTIDSNGPRYCPSVEDKVVRFPDKDSHRIFLEPEGLSTWEVYPNGFSTSLPVEVQARALRTMRGLEQVRIVRPGYAIEYDYADPRDLGHDLGSRHLDGLYLAGQINGTTGYEEAAAQGLLAGLNAARYCRGDAPVIIDRSQGYLGVLVDDLVSRGTKEPYRMFTSRAEWRLLLREDNADLRLTPLGRQVGLVSDERWSVFESRRDQIERGLDWMRRTVSVPGDPVDRWLKQSSQPGLSKPTSISDLVKRPEVGFEELVDAAGLTPPSLSAEVVDQLITQCRYEGYIKRQEEEVEKMRGLQSLSIPDSLVYSALAGLRAELIEKLEAQRPSTLGEAAEIPGMTPAAVALLASSVRRQAASP